MVSLENYTWEDDKSKKELMDNVVIEKTTFDDTLQVVQLLVKCFGVPNEKEAFNQLLTTRSNLWESVKLVDKRDGKIYGLLIFSEFKISDGSPINFFSALNPISKYLGLSSQVNGFAFVIDKRLRGLGYDKKMLFFNREYISKFDFIWCGVDNKFKSHHYWERLGFYKLFEIKEATFYIMKPLKKDMNDIFILKALSEFYDEKDYNRREYREEIGCLNVEREH